MERKNEPKSAGQVIGWYLQVWGKAMQVDLLPNERELWVSAFQSKNPQLLDVACRNLTRTMKNFPRWGELTEEISRVEEDAQVRANKTQTEFCHCDRCHGMGYVTHPIAGHEPHTQITRCDCHDGHLPDGKIWRRP